MEIFFIDNEQLKVEKQALLNAREILERDQTELNQTKQEFNIFMPQQQLNKLWEIQRKIEYPTRKIIGKRDTHFDLGGQNF